MPLKEMPEVGTRVILTSCVSDPGMSIPLQGTEYACGGGVVRWVRGEKISLPEIHWDNGMVSKFRIEKLDLETPEPTTTKVPLREKVYGNADDMHTAHLKSQAEATEAQHKREDAQWKAALSRHNFSAKNARVHFFLTGEPIDREVFGEGD